MGLVLRPPFLVRCIPAMPGVNMGYVACIMALRAPALALAKVAQQEMGGSLDIHALQLHTKHVMSLPNE